VLKQTLLPDAHIIVMDLNKEGAAPTRQRALMMANTDWVAFLDSDDVLMPQHLEWLMKCALEHEADFVYSWFKVLQEHSDGRQQVLEFDPVFPPGHFLNDWNPDEPIETTVTTFVRTKIAQAVGFHALDRGHDANTGEDFGFTLGCRDAGAKIVHLKRHSWLWSHSFGPDGKPLNTSGRANRGDDVAY
jgi:glycosyltransferase involved in cell wall biosynthesis